MHEIDFLPPSYHEQNARRQVKPWRIVVVAMFIVLLASAAFAQYYQRSRAQRELKATEPYYEETIRLGERLRQVEAQREAAESDAALFTYLRHPWPRTQLLRALVTPLPAEVALEQVLVGEETPPDRTPPPASGPKGSKAEEEKAKKTPPSQRDLQTLRDQCDSLQTIVRVTGTTSDAAALYAYLHELSRAGLFAKAELRSIESLDLPGGVTLRFQLLLAVLPGYGQPGGPEGKPL